MSRSTSSPGASDTFTRSRVSASSTPSRSRIVPRAAGTSLLRRCCSPFELATLEAALAADRHDLFLRYWTLKEAFLKARGLGLSVPLSSISLTLDGRRASIAFADALAGWSTGWEFRLEQLTRHHLMAVAVAALDEPSTFVITPLPPGILEP